MTATDLVMQILAGGLLGMLGQGARVVAGLKKSSDGAAAVGQSLKDVFDGGALMRSLLIGFIAGALALLAAGPSGPLARLDHGMIMAIIASGYAGTDFIEAFIKKNLPDNMGAVSAAAPFEPPMG